MTFAELKAELVARGAENDATRNGRFINRAYHEIVNRYEWPFLIATNTGAAGAGVAPLGTFRKILLVADVSGFTGNGPGRKLQKITFEELTEDPLLMVENVDRTGTPVFWYVDFQNSQIKTYPVGGTILARMVTRASDMTAVGDTPIFSDEYSLLIIDRAMVEVYKDNAEYESAAATMQNFERSLALMANDFMLDAREPSYIQVNPFDG